MKKILFAVLFIFNSPAVHCQTLAGSSQNGFGVYAWKSGGIYSGFWKNGKRNYFGVSMDKDGHMHMILYKNGDWQKRGVSFWKDGGFEYRSEIIGYDQTGCLAGNCTDGYGIYAWADGTIYSGFWKNGVQHYFGFSLDKSGNSHFLQYKQAKWQKKGVSFWKDGTYEYRSDMVDFGETGCVSGDCQNGMGVYIWDTGAMYAGHWKNGERHYFGVTMDKDGHSHFLLYKDGDWKNRGVSFWKKGDYKYHIGDDAGLFINTSDAVNYAPVISITEPDISRGFKAVRYSSIRVAGTASDSDGIHEVLVNGIRAAVQQNGSFSANVALARGDNTITVKAVDSRMKSSLKSFQITRDSGTAAVSEKRLALVIGNSNYDHGGSLTNPVNDARAVKISLERLGFKVMEYENCTQKTMKRAIDQFGSELKNYKTGLFYYAGHGLQVGGNNYLIPSDARLENENDVEYDCIRAGRILAKMEAAQTRTNIVILDACRDNPFERSWNRGAKGKGLAFMNAPSGSLIAYATSPGNTASDGSAANGLYTSALLQHLNTPGLTIENVFKRVRTAVMEQSGGKQIPWESTSLTGNFYFKQ